MHRSRDDNVQEVLGGEMGTLTNPVQIGLAYLCCISVLTRDTAITILCVRPSVGLSVAFRYCVETA